MSNKKAVKIIKVNTTVVWIWDMLTKNFIRGWNNAEKGWEDLIRKYPECQKLDWGYKIN